MFRNAKRIAVGLALAGALIWGVAVAASHQAVDSALEEPLPNWTAVQMREIFPH